MPVFDRSEYEDRIKRTKESMIAGGMDLLVVSHPANMNYLTGYDGWSFYVHQAVLVSLSQEEPIWVGRSMDANGARLTTFLPEENIREYPDDYVHSPVKHPMSFIAGVIREKALSKGSIGLEMDQFHFTHRGFVELEKSLPSTTFKDANALVNWVRVVKSDAEIEFLRRAGKIAEAVMERAVKSIGVGVRECDAAAAIAHAEYSGTEEFAGDYPAVVPLMMAGEAASAPHLTWTERKFKANEPVLLELAGTYRHYHAPIARTIFLGPNPPPLLRETAEVVLDGLAKTLEFIKPGVTAEEVEAAWRRAISHSRVVKESRLGYSIGVNYPPDWGEHTISLRPGDKTVLRENMALHLIPGIWHKDVGFETDASIVVTKDGNASLYDYPNKLFTTAAEA